MKIRLFTLTFLAAVVFAGCTYEEVTPLPVTPTEKRLNYYIESYKVPGLGFVPQTKVSYEYNETGRVRKYTVLSYHPDSGSLSELRYFVFSYVHNRVDNIKGFLAGENSPYVEYSYKYLVNNTVSMIRETNYAAGVNSELNFLYNAVDNSITATYTFSNGGSFEYEFNYESENILNDKTTRGAQLCSNGQYTYDQHINPFRNLGYVDYTLNNRGRKLYRLFVPHAGTGVLCL